MCCDVFGETTQLKKPSSMEYLFDAKTIIWFKLCLAFQYEKRKGGKSEKNHSMEKWFWYYTVWLFFHDVCKIILIQFARAAYIFRKPFSKIIMIITMMMMMIAPMIIRNTKRPKWSLETHNNLVEFILFTTKINDASIMYTYKAGHIE